MRRVNIPIGSDTIVGNLFEAKKPGGYAFLFIQGWMGGQNLAAAESLANNGFTSLTYNMRGNKESSGDLAKLSRADFVNDAVEAYDFLAEQVPKGTKIGVVGSSFGAYTGILLTEKRPVVCLSLRVPADYPDKGYEEPQLPHISLEALWPWRETERGFDDNMAYRALHNFTGPVQIIEAERDESIPHQAVQNYANAVADKSKLEHVTMFGAPHRILTQQVSDEYVRNLTNWVRGVTGGKK